MGLRLLCLAIHHLKTKWQELKVGSLIYYGFHSKTAAHVTHHKFTPNLVINGQTPLMNKVILTLTHKLNSFWKWEISALSEKRIYVTPAGSRLLFEGNCLLIFVLDVLLLFVIHFGLKKSSYSEAQVYTASK